MYLCIYVCVCVCVFFEHVCCAICNFGISRKYLTQKNLCASNFNLKWGENATDKSIKGSLFYKQEKYVLTLVRMGEPATLSNTSTYGSNYSMKHQNSCFSVYCFIQILSEFIMRLLYYSIAKKIPIEDSVEFVF